MHGTGRPRAKRLSPAEATQEALKRIIAAIESDADRMEYLANQKLAPATYAISNSSARLVVAHMRMHSEGLKANLPKGTGKDA